MNKLQKAMLQPFRDGDATGYVPNIAAMVSAYYDDYSWDHETGKPIPGKLHELGMQDV